MSDKTFVSKGHINFKYDLVHSLTIQYEFSNSEEELLLVINEKDENAPLAPRIRSIAAKFELKNLFEEFDLIRLQELPYLFERIRETVFISREIGISFLEKNRQIMITIPIDHSDEYLNIIFTPEKIYNFGCVQESFKFSNSENIIDILSLLETLKSIYLSKPKSSDNFNFTKKDVAHDRDTLTSKEPFPEYSLDEIFQILFGTQH